MEFLEFCWTNAWRVVILLYIGASIGGALCYVIASMDADGRMADMFADLDNPANVSKRIGKKARKKEWIDPEVDPDLINYVEKGAAKE